LAIYQLRFDTDLVEIGKSPGAIVLPLYDKLLTYFTDLAKNNTAPEPEPIPTRTGTDSDRDRDRFRPGPEPIPTGTDSDLDRDRFRPGPEPIPTWTDPSIFITKCTIQCSVFFLDLLFDCDQFLKTAQSNCTENRSALLVCVFS
jgi:hypothetical protein